MKRLLITFVLVTAVILTACGSRAAATQAPAYNSAAPMAPEERGAVGDTAVEPQKAVAESNVAGSAVPPAVQDRLVIQNADLSLVVKDPKAKMDQMTAMAERMGGYIVSSNIYQAYAPDGEQVPEGSIVIRVPVEKLEDALKEIKENVVEVQNENRSGQDVTQEYVDLKSRLKNLEAAEVQLTRIMEEATKTEDVLNVFNQLNSYREQIEVVKGQMQYFEQSSSYSAISARIVAEKTIQPIVVGGWEPKGVARDAIQDLIYFMQGVVDFLIRFALLGLPVLLVIGLFIAVPIWIVYMIVRAFMRRSKKSATPPAAPKA